MIHITGDCHGEYRRFGSGCFPEQEEMGKGDYVIVCGDFGMWSRSKEQRHWRAWLKEKPFTVLWADGNHENYDLLKEYEMIQWNGGRVQLVDGSIHLMRGQVYEFAGKRWFVFGGARSHDISGGILEKNDPGYYRKKKQLDRRREEYRVNHESWWKEEMPSEEEFEEGRRNLEAVGWKVDYVITHCAPTSIQEQLTAGEERNGRPDYVPDELTDYLEEIKERLDFKQWFFGHYHRNQVVEGRFGALYEQIIRIL